jgi:hypothetical protein
MSIIDQHFRRGGDVARDAPRQKRRSRRLDSFAFPNRFEQCGYTGLASSLHKLDKYGLLIAKKIHHHGKILPRLIAPNITILVLSICSWHC